MNFRRIAFLVSGVIAGLLVVVLGLWSPVFLAYGVGPLFFSAVVAGIAITDAWRYVEAGFWRFVAALLLTTIAYVTALLAFSVVAGFTPDWFGIARSSKITDVGVDILLGLLAAGVLGALGISAFGTVLTGTWRTALLMRLMLAAFVTTIVTFVTNLPFRSYWSSLGVLLPLGNALFCWLIGAHIWVKPASLSGIASHSPQADAISLNSQ
jgi:hypothetical protein